MIKQAFYIRRWFRKLWGFIYLFIVSAQWRNYNFYRILNQVQSTISQQYGSPLCAYVGSKVSVHQVKIIIAFDFLSIFIIKKIYFTNKFHSRLISVNCKFEIKRLYTEFSVTLFFFLLISYQFLQCSIQSLIVLGENMHINQTLKTSFYQCPITSEKTIILDHIHHVQYNS